MAENEFDPIEQTHRRSPLLMNRHDTALIVIDVQQKLLPHIDDHDVMEFNITRLIDGARVLQIPVYATEQYPKGLGPTVSSVRDTLGEAPCFEKTMFSVRESRTLLEALNNGNVKHVLLTGIETHVCVFQSAMDLMSEGFNVCVCIDAVGSRSEEDFMTAMQRMETAGAVLVSTEMALFEWCERAGTPEFKKVSAIVQRQFEPTPQD